MQQLEIIETWEDGRLKVWTCSRRVHTFCIDTGIKFIPLNNLPGFLLLLLVWSCGFSTAFAETEGRGIWIGKSRNWDELRRGRREFLTLVCQAKGFYTRFKSSWKRESDDVRVVFHSFLKALCLWCYMSICLIALLVLFCWMVPSSFFPPLH